MEVVDPGRDRRSFFHRFTLGFDLFVRGLVRLARICIHFLVHLPGQARNIFRLSDPHHGDPARRILVDRTRLLVLLIRSSHGFY